jgi:hypothetical protein
VPRYGQSPRPYLGTRRLQGLRSIDWLWALRDRELHLFLFSLRRRDHDATVKSNHSWTVYNTHQFESHGSRERKKRGKKKSGAQAIITTPLWHRQEGYEQLTEESLMIGIPRPDGFRSRELPSRHSLGRRCTQTPATPAQTLAWESVTRLWSALVRPPTGPR